MMALKLCLISLFCSCGFSVDYSGYKIYEISAQTPTQASLLHQFSVQDGFDTLHVPHVLNASAHIMVRPEYQSSFESNLTRYQLNYKILVKNVQRSLKENGLRKQREPFNGKKIDFTQYYRYSEINKYLEELSFAFPDIVSVQAVGTSYEGRKIKIVRVSVGGEISKKNVIFIDAGIHAREWIAPATALYIIQQLVENLETNRDLLSSYDWIILPLVNPDGYEYSHTTDRMWRKTRSKYFFCCGTDGNRNFDYHWGEIGASYDPCSDTYRGPKPFSEPETKVVRNLLLALKGRGKFYLTLHSYGNYLLYPWGWTSQLPKNYKNLDEIAAAGASAIHKATGTRYTYGSSTRVLYPAAGGSDDYAYAVAGFPISITMELSRGGTGFDPKPSQIKGMVEEAWIGIKAMAEKVIAKY